jgi:ATP-binding cassette subfamily F protein uup
MSTIPTILSAQSVSKSFGAQPVLDNISLSVHENERIGLIGRNGAGKSTLMKILAGLIVPDAGKVTQKKGLRVGMLSQESSLDPALTVNSVMEGACLHAQDLIARHDQLLEEISSADEDKAHSLHADYEHLTHEMNLTHAWDWKQEVDKLYVQLGLPEPDRVLDTLSGGERRRVDLAASLLNHPDVLLLDEPTNHIDAKSAQWIEQYLSKYEGSCVLITHDRYFLELVVERIVEIEFSKLYSFPGTYHNFLERKAAVVDVEERTESSRQNVLRRELEWLRRGPKARSTKQKARIQRYDDLEGQGPPQRHKETNFQIPEPPRLGKRILDVTKLDFSIDGRPLFRDFNLILQKEMRIGIVGPNGCGKTTLLRCLMGEVPPQSGKVLIGDTTEFLYIDQTHSDINPENTILEFVSGGGNYWEVNGNRVYVPAYLENLLFDGDSVRSPMKNLSGGERNRIELAKKLLQGGNVLILDEPTNDLDLPTLRVLEDAITNFNGPAIIVSHDRYFLNRLCTHLIVFDTEGPLYFSAGNYDDYLLYKKNQSIDTAPPKSTAAKSTAKADPEKKPTNKLTYQEKKELATIEQTIQEAEEALARCNDTIAKPGFYEQPHAIVQQELENQQQAQQKVTALYQRWEELEAKDA